MKRLPIAILTALALPSTASAATLEELPFQALADRQGAGCLRPTGTAGGLSLFGRPGAIDLWRADGAGTSRGERARLGRHLQCGAVAEAGGAAVAAALVSAGDENVVRAAVREAGAAFGAATDLSRGPNPQDVAAAMSPAGHAVVVWTERRGRPREDRQRLRVVAVRRLPGQGFGAPEPVTEWWTTSSFDEPEPEVAIDASGTVSVVWSQVAGRRRSVQRANVAVAAPGAGFVRQRLAIGSDFSASVAIAVAPGGWSLVAHGAGDSGLAVFERPPGAPRFTRVELPRGDALASVEGPAVAVDDAGGAVVAWRTEPAFVGSAVAAMTRAAGGALSAPQLFSRVRPLFFDGAGAIAITGAAPPEDADTERLRIALGPGGRALIGWIAFHHGVPSHRARAAVGVLGGRFEPAQGVSPSLRDAAAVAPLFLDDGRAALAWIDNDSLTLTSAFRTGGGDDGRLHLAVEGAAAPISQAPRLQLRAARVQRLFPTQPVRVNARCDRPCDISGAVSGVDDVSLTTDSAVELALPRDSLFDSQDGRTGVLKLNVRAAEPGGSTVARRSVRVRVVPRPRLPVFRPLGVRVRRRGGEISVRWRTAGPARRMYFAVYGQRARRDESVILRAGDFLRGRGRTRFTGRIPAAGVRWVTVIAIGIDGGPSRRVLVRLR